MGVQAVFCQLVDLLGGRLGVIRFAGELRVELLDQLPGGCRLVGIEFDRFQRVGAGRDTRHCIRYHL